MNGSALLVGLLMGVPSTPVSGTYDYLGGPRAGCRLEAAPTSSDSVRVQLECTNPAHHIGFLDARLRLHDRVVEYVSTTDHKPCRIRIQFTDDHAVVHQEGSDLACGFGFGVNASGTYRRTSRQRPAFDLNPIG